MTDHRREIILAAAEAGARYLAAKDATTLDREEARRMIRRARREAGSDDDRAALHALCGLAEAWMRRQAESLRRELMAEGKAVVGSALARIREWRDRVARFLRRAFLAASLILTDPMTPADEAAFEVAYKAQMAYLDGFAGELAVGDVETDTGSFPSRSSLYGAAAWVVAEAVARSHATSSGSYTEEMRILGGEVHCDVCPQLAALGWQPLGSLPAIGEGTPCRVRCRCSMAYR